MGIWIYLYIYIYSYDVWIYMSLLIYSIFLDASNNSATRFACETPQHQATIFMDFWLLTTTWLWGRGRHGTTWMPKVRDSIHELLPSALRSLESAKWGRIIVREVHRFLSCIFVHMVYIYIDHIGWFSPLLVFQCKCSDVRCFIFGISLAQALLKLCAKLFSWLSYLIFDHAWARARPGWSVPGQK